MPLVKPACVNPIKNCQYFSMYVIPPAIYRNQSRLEFCVLLFRPPPLYKEIESIGCRGQLSPLTLIFTLANFPPSIQKELYIASLTFGTIQTSEINGHLKFSIYEYMNASH